MALHINWNFYFLGWHHPPLPPVPFQCLLILNSLLASSRHQPSGTPLTTTIDDYTCRQAGDDAGKIASRHPSACAARLGDSGQANGDGNQSTETDCRNGRPNEVVGLVGASTGGSVGGDGEVLLATINVLNALLWIHCQHVRGQGGGQGDGGTPTTVAPRANKVRCRAHEKSTPVARNGA